MQGMKRRKEEEVNADDGSQGIEQRLIPVRGRSLVIAPRGTSLPGSMRKRTLDFGRPWPQIYDLNGYWSRHMPKKSYADQPYTSYETGQFNDPRLARRENAAQ